MSTFTASTPVSAAVAPSSTTKKKTVAKPVNTVVSQAAQADKPVPAVAAAAPAVEKKKKTAKKTAAATAVAPKKDGGDEGKKKKTKKAKKAEEEEEEEEEDASEPLTKEEEIEIKQTQNVLGADITSAANRFKRQYNQNVAIVSTVLMVDFLKEANVTDKTVCRVCDERLSGKCASVMKLTGTTPVNATLCAYIHPECLRCVHLTTGGGDACCGAACVFVLPSEPNKQRCHVHNGEPLCGKHISDANLSVPCFEAGSREGTTFLQTWGFVKYRAADMDWKAEEQRVYRGIGLMNGFSGEAILAKVEEPCWETGVTWPEKQRMRFGLLCNATVTSDMSDARKKLLKGSMRAEPIMSNEAFAVRAAITSILRDCFPAASKSRKNYMAHFGEYIIIPKEAEKLTVNNRLQWYAGERRVRQSDTRANDLDLVFGFVSFTDMDARKGGVSVIVCPDKYTMSGENRVFFDMMDKITPRAPNGGLFPEDHPFAGLPVVIPLKAGECIMFRNGRPFKFFTGTENVVGMVTGASGMTPKKETKIQRAQAVENGVVPTKDPNRAGIKYGARVDMAVSCKTPSDWLDIFTRVDNVGKFAAEIFGTGYVNPSQWPEEYKPKHAEFAVVEEEMQAVVEEEEQTKKPVAPEATKPKKKKAAVAAAAAAVEVEPPQPKKKKQQQPPKKKEEVAEPMEIDDDDDDEEKEVPTGGAGKKKSGSGASAKKAKATANLVSPSVEKSEDEYLEMRPVDELVMNPEFFGQEDAPAAVTTFIVKNGNDKTTGWNKVEGEDKVQGELPRGTTVTLSRMDIDEEDATAMAAHVNEMIGRERKKKNCGGQLLFLGKESNLYGAPYHYQKIHEDPEQETPDFVTSIMDKLNADLPQDTPRINQCYMHAFSRKVDFISPVTRMQDLHDGAPMHLVCFGNEARTIRLRSFLTATGEKKKGGTGEMLLDLNAISGMCVTLSQTYAHEENGVTYEVTKLPTKKGEAKSDDSAEPDCEPLTVLAFYACAPISRTGTTAKGAPKYTRSKPKAKAKQAAAARPVKKAKVAAAESNVSSAVGVNMSKAEKKLGSKTHNQTLDEFGAFLKEHAAFLKAKKNVSIEAAGKKTIEELLQSTKNAGKLGVAGLGGFQKCFSMLYLAVTGNQWDAGAIAPPPPPSAQSSSDSSASLSDDEEPPQQKKKKQQQPQKKVAVAPVKAKVASKKNEDEDMQTVPRSPGGSLMTEKGSLFAVPEKTRKMVVTASGEVALRSARPKAAPVKTKAQMQQEVEDGHLADELTKLNRQRAKKNKSEMTLAQYKLRLHREMLTEELERENKTRAKAGKSAITLEQYEARIAAKDRKRAREEEDDEDEDDEAVRFDASDSDSDDDDEVDSDDEDDEDDSSSSSGEKAADHKAMKKRMASRIEILDALYTRAVDKLEGPKKDKKLVALYNECDTAKDACEAKLTSVSLATFCEAVDKLSLALGVEDAKKVKKEPEAAEAGNKKKRVIDLTGATVVQQGWNAEQDAEGKKTASFVASSLDLLSLCLRACPSNSDVEELLELTNGIINSPPSAGLSRTIMAEFERLSALVVAHMTKKNKKQKKKQAEPEPEVEEQQQEEEAEVVPDVVQSKGKEEEEEEEAPIAQQEDDGEAAPMEVEQEQEQEEEEQEEEEDEEEKEVLPALDDENDKVEMVAVHSNNQEESDTVSSSDEEEEAAAAAEPMEVDGDEEEEEEQVAAVAAADEEEEEEEEEVAAVAADEEDEDEEDEDEGSAEKAVKDTIKVAKPEEQEKMVDENPSPIKGKRARPAAEEIAATAPAAAAHQSPLKKQHANVPVAAVIYNTRIIGAFETEAEARAAVPRQITLKEGESIDSVCTFRPLPPYWKTFLTGKCREPVIHNLAGVLQADLYPPPPSAT